MKATKCIAAIVFGEWRITTHRCYRDHGPVNVCPRCVAL